MIYFILLEVYYLVIVIKGDGSNGCGNYMISFNYGVVGGECYDCGFVSDGGGVFSCGY